MKVLLKFVFACCVLTHCCWVVDSTNYHQRFNDGFRSSGYGTGESSYQTRHSGVAVGSGYGAQNGQSTNYQSGGGAQNGISRGAAVGGSLDAGRSYAFGQSTADSSHYATAGPRGSNWYLNGAGGRGQPYFAGAGFAPISGRFARPNGFGNRYLIGPYGSVYPAWGRLPGAFSSAGSQRGVQNVGYAAKVDNGIGGVDETGAQGTGLASVGGGLNPTTVVGSDGFYNGPYSPFRGDGRYQDSSFVAGFGSGYLSNRGNALPYGLSTSTPTTSQNSGGYQNLANRASTGGAVVGSSHNTVPVSTNNNRPAGSVGDTIRTSAVDPVNINPNSRGDFTSTQNSALASQGSSLAQNQHEPTGSGDQGHLSHSNAALNGQNRADESLSHSNGFGQTASTSIRTNPIETARSQGSRGFGVDGSYPVSAGSGISMGQGSTVGDANGLNYFRNNAGYANPSLLSGRGNQFGGQTGTGLTDGSSNFENSIYNGFQRESNGLSGSIAGSDSRGHRSDSRYNLGNRAGFQTSGGGVASGVTGSQNSVGPSGYGSEAVNGYNANRGTNAAIANGAKAQGEQSIGLKNLNGRVNDNGSYGLSHDSGASSDGISGGQNSYNTNIDQLGFNSETRYMNEGEMTEASFAIKG
ncbi:fibroin heavy chain-like isoform X2 [Topomyia yanbarensis]|uniref:fibroin heavy chain-like isoform X2 n=1 Tax=Topomyia yanbarensis TaxID=2498891 RepID=UPI00273AA2BA|nr:fibroin heavy chain-like isoform X2 [Topomyia yanbarensis]